METTENGTTMRRARYQSSDIPYESFERFGLSRAAVDDFPDDVLMPLKDGRFTPLLPLHLSIYEKGEPIDIELYARAQLRGPSGQKADLWWLPELRVSQLEKGLDGNENFFTEEEKKTLLEGGIVTKRSDDGPRNIYQYDPDSKQLVFASADIIRENIKNLTEKICKDDDVADTKKKIQNGKPCEILVQIDSDTKTNVTFGIDLLSSNEGSGLRYIIGSEEQWKAEKTRHEGLLYGMEGAWRYEEGRLKEYIPDVDYTTEMRMESDRKNMQHSQGMGYHAEMGMDNDYNIKR